MSDTAKIHFEDFTVGSVDTYGQYLLTIEELKAFAREFDPQPFHLDEKAAAGTMLGGIAASGWHACAITMRINVDHFMGNSTSLGSPGIEEVKWLKPLRPGSVLSVRRTVLDARPSSSRPELGLVRFDFELIADGADPVLTQRGWIMFGRRTRDVA